MHPRSLILTVGFCCFAFQIERAYGQDQKFEKGQTVVVAVDEATVYRGKNAVGAVRKGQELLIVDENLAWLGIEWTAEDGERKSGWLLKNQVGVKQERRTVFVTAKTADVYRGKNVVGKVKAGQKLTVVDENIDWYGVEWTAAGETRNGWIRKEQAGGSPVRRIVIVNQDEANVMQGANLVGTVTRGQELTALRKRDDWLAVEWTIDGETKSGWIKEDQVVPRPEGESVTVSVAQASVMRGAAVVAEVTRGQKLIALRKNEDWVGVEWTTPDGEVKSGWIKEDQIEYPKVAVPIPGPVAAAGILVRSIRLEGNTLIPSEVLKSFFPDSLQAGIPTIGVRVPVDEVRKGLESILSAYHESGYRGVAVYIPQDNIERASPLTFRNDELTVKVVEGQVNSTDVTYRVQRRWRPWRLKKTFRRTNYDRRVEARLAKLSPIAPGGFLHRDELEGYVEMLERRPGRSVAAVVKKADRTSAVSDEAVGRDIDLEFRVVDPEPTSFYLQMSNDGSEDTVDRFRLGFLHNNLLGRDDSLTLDFQGPFDGDIFDNYGFFGSYNMPLWDQKWRLNTYGAYNEFQTSNIIGDNSPFIGEGFIAGEELTYNLVHRDSWFVDVFGGLEYQNSTLESPFFAQFGINPTISDISLLDVSIGVRASKVKGKVRPSGSLELLYNLSDLTGLNDASDFEDSRSDTKPGYFIARLSGQYTAQINQWLRLYQRMQATVTPDRLIGARQFSMSPRGYEGTSALGDAGFMLVTEPSISINALYFNRTNKTFPFRLDFIPLFFDLGVSKNNDTGVTETSSTTLYSIGTGARVSFKDLLAGRIFWGHALRDASATGNESGDNRIHVDFTFRW
ncbi:MAG: hypothetical protein QF473_09625 [Planctomycetota bacterium]|nr:hypothetical protein [Planctomycetota bacterium]